MKDLSIASKALDVLPILNTAIKNVRLYPPSSSTVISTQERLYQAFTNLLDGQEQIMYAESEKNLIICDRQVSLKDQERPHLASLLGMLIAFGIKSIVFRNGLTPEELSFFVEQMARAPELIQREGGLEKLLTDHHVTHIALDQKVYVAVDKNRQILATLDITDDQISRFLILSHPDMDPTSPQLKEMAKDPKALSRAFEIGLSQTMTQKGSLSGVQITENVNHMLWLLDRLSGDMDDKNRGILSKDVGRTLAKADPTMSKHLTSQNMEHLLGGMLLQYLMDELPQEAPGAQASAGIAQSPSPKEAVPVKSFKKPAPAEAEAETGDKKVMQIAKKYVLHIQDDRTLMDKSLMSVMSKIVEELIAQKEQETMKNMIERLAENLKNPKSEIRASAGGGLADIIEHLPDELVGEVLASIDSRLRAWMATEPLYSTGYEKICIILKNKAQKHLAQKQYAQALPYLEAFSADHPGPAAKTDDVKKINNIMISQLASWKNLQDMMDDIDTPESAREQDARQFLNALGNAALNTLLDQLRTTADSDIRVRIMHLLRSVRDKALPLIMIRLKKDEPWYFMRNLAYMMGQIGDDQSAESLAPLLRHDNVKVRQEALKSIQRIGGRQKAKLLLSALFHVRDDFKINLVEALGQARAVEAVERLILLLRDRPLRISATRITLEEKICVALGVIGSPEAIPFLSEIAETKKILGLRDYPEKIKSAAARTLVILRRKIAEAGEES